MAKHVSIVLALAVSLVVLFSPTNSQMQTGCTSAMLTSFTPCMNFVTNSTGNGVSPTSDCCNSLKSLMSNGTDCMCLVATGSVPFQIPVNRTMAMSLPRACKMPGVPLQCKATAAPVPAPGPTAFGPSLSPTASTANPSSAAPEPSSATSALAPEADSTQLLTPPSSTTGNSGSRPVLTPSAARISYQFSPSLLFAMLAATILKSYF